MPKVCSEVDGIITCEMGTLESGEDFETLTITGQVSEAGTISKHFEYHS